MDEGIPDTVWAALRDDRRRFIQVAINEVEENLLKRPLMMATTREAYVAQLALLLNLFGKDGRQLYGETLNRQGSVLLSVREDASVEWRQSVADLYLQLKGFP